jgi:hypothetical protein
VAWENEAGNATAGILEMFGVNVTEPRRTSNVRHAHFGIGPAEKENQLRLTGLPKAETISAAALR